MAQSARKIDSPALAESCKAKTYLKAVGLAGEENFELEFVLLDRHDQDSTVFRRAGV